MQDLEYEKERILLLQQKGGNWTREGVLYLPQKGKFLTKDSPILQNPREAVQQYIKRPRIAWIPTEEQIERALQDSIQIPKEYVQEQLIPTNIFGENPVTKYVFGSAADDYGKFLREARIKNMRIITEPQDYVNQLGKPLMLPIYFGSLTSDSFVDGSTHWCFVNNGNLRGVKEK